MKKIEKVLMDLQDTELKISNTAKGPQIQQTERNAWGKRIIEALYEDYQKVFPDNNDSDGIVAYRLKDGIILEVPNASVSDALPIDSMGSGAVSIQLNVVIKGLDFNASEEAVLYEEKRMNDLEKARKAEADKAAQIARDAARRAERARKRQKLLDATKIDEDEN